MAKPIDWRQSQIRTSDLLAYFNELLAADREKNDDIKKSIEETNQLRGRICLLKDLIRLPVTQATLSALRTPPED